MRRYLKKEKKKHDITVVWAGLRAASCVRKRLNNSSNNTVLHVRHEVTKHIKDVLLLFF